MIGLSPTGHAPALRASQVAIACVSLLALGIGCTGSVLGDSSSTGAPGLAAGDEPAADPSTTADPEVIDTPDGIGWATRFPKLSNAQWEATVRDLFQLPAPTNLSETFSPEPADGGYENQAAAAMTIAGDAWLRYQLAAEEVARRVTSDPALLTKLTPEGASSAPAERARIAIVELGLRSYRRPLLAQEEAAYLGLFDVGATFDSQDPFRGGISLVIETMLQSPHFLYRVESSTQEDLGRIWLNGYEVATRLSYALWNTMPPRELLAAAGAGELSTAEGAKRWATQLLADPRASTTLAKFHEQTFHTGSYGTQSKDERFGFDAAALAPMLQEEARLFFAEVLGAGGGIRELLTKPVAFVNEQTAPFYGITGITGTQLQRVELDVTRRAGLLSQLGFLAQTGARTLTDPVHRGLSILRQVLCDDPDPPPPIDLVTPQLEPGLTTRQVYEKATACGVGCHDTLINPPGFAFEHFDTVGRWRDDEAGLPIDVSGTFGVRVGWTPQAKRENQPILLDFDGAADLLTQIAALERTHECYARHLLEFVLAKSLAPQERGAGALLGKQSLERGEPQAILAELVTLNAFRARALDSL